MLKLGAWLNIMNVIFSKKKKKNIITSKMKKTQEGKSEISQNVSKIYFI